MDTLDERLRRAGAFVAPPEPALDRLDRRRQRRLRNRRIGSTIVALSVAAGGIGAAMVSLGALGDREAIQTPTAQPGAQPPPPLREGDYFYEETVRLLPNAFGLGGGRVIEQTWWGQDGSGRRVGDSTPDYGLGPLGTWGPGEMEVEDLSGLSTDPDVVVDQLRQRSAPDGASPQPPGTPGPGIGEDSASMWRAIGHLLEMPNAEPALRAALFEVASRISGVEMREDAEDPVGRRAISLSMSVSDSDVTLFFDPDTLQPLASTEDYGGDAVWYRIVRSAGIVASTEEQPQGTELLVPPPAEPLPEGNG